MSQHNLLSFDHLYSLDCGIMEVYTLGSMVPMGGGSSGLVKLRSGWVGLTQAVGMVRLLPPGPPRRRRWRGPPGSGRLRGRAPRAGPRSRGGAERAAGEEAAAGGEGWWRSLKASLRTSDGGRKEEKIIVWKMRRERWKRKHPIIVKSECSCGEKRKTLKTWKKQTAELQTCEYVALTT